MFLRRIEGYYIIRSNCLNVFNSVMEYNFVLRHFDVLSKYKMS